MVENNQQIPYLVLVGVVAVVAIVVLVMNGSDSLQGAPTFNKVKGSTKQTICTDTDDKEYYYKKGTVKLGLFEYPDYCGNDNNYDTREGEKVLFQHYCKTGDEFSITDGYPCPNGCSDGACKR